MKRIIIFLLALALAFSASAQQSQPVPTDPAVRIGKLSNGITYYIRHHEEPAGQANFYIAQKVGSILENENQRGLAHFLEHMCFNGTQKFPGNGVIKYCESIGVKFGADLNAYTSIDETVYNIDNVPVGNVPSAIDSCLWILHDWADGLLLTDEDIDKERGVIHEEWRSRSTSMMRLYEKILPVLYPGNIYGQRMPIGTMEVVDNFPYSVLRDYYEKWYRPDQQGIIVVGDIDVNAVEAKIKDIFGGIQPQGSPAPRVYTKIEDNKEPIVVLATDKEQPYALTYIFMKHAPYPVEQRGDVNYLLYSFAQDAAQIMINARIQEMLQSPNPPFIQAQVEDDDFFIAKTEKAFTGVVVSAETNIESASTTLYREMLRAVRGGFTESEFERAKAEIMTHIESAYNQRDKRKSASLCREYVRHFVDNEPIPGIEYEYALAQQLMPMVTVELVNNVVRTVEEDGNLAVCYMLPEKEGVTYPTTEALSAAFLAVEAENIAPYVDKVSNEPLITNYPAMGTVIDTKPAMYGYTKYTFENGAVVYFKQTDFNKDEVLVRAFSDGGTSLCPVENANELKVLDELITIGGVGNFSATELTKVLAGKKVKVTPWVDTFAEGIRTKTTPKDFETALQLNYLYFTAMRNDYEAFESWQQREIASVKNREANPMAALQDTLITAMYNGNPRVGALKVADVEKINYNFAMQLARQRFASAGDFTFIVTGAIDEATALPLIRQYIGSLPSTGFKETSNLKALEYAKGSKKKVFDKPMQIPMATNIFAYLSPMKYTLKDAAAFDLALNALTIVLLEEIREKEGGTYGIGAYGELEGYPRKEAAFQIGYKCNPERMDYLNGRVMEIVAEFAAKGPSEENLSKGKEYFIKNYKENLAENSYHSASLANYLHTRVDTMTNYEAVVSAITVEDVRKVFEKVLKNKNNLTVIMKGVPVEQK